MTGRDTITNNLDVTSRIYGGAGDDTIYGGNGRDTIYGEQDRDTIQGGSHQDTIYGGRHNDFLFGQGETDWLYGEADDDWLEAGSANETAETGGGRDFNPHRIAFNGTTPADVVQGDTGTEWFLAALAAARTQDFTSRIRYLGGFRFEVRMSHPTANPGAPLIAVPVVVTFDGSLHASDPRVNASSIGGTEFWPVLMHRALLQKWASTSKIPRPLAVRLGVCNRD